MTNTNIIYGMHCGLALLMDMHQPANGNGYAIVYINGCGWHAPLAYQAEQLKETPLGMPWIEALCEAGYTVFAINHRAAPMFRYPCALQDAQRAVRFVRFHADRFGIRPESIGACGGSSGGHLSSLLGTLPGAGAADDPDPVNRASSSVQCVAARAAPVDLARLVGSGGGSLVASFLGMPLRGEAGGAYALEHRTYHEASPLHHVSNSAPPFLLIHGDVDEIVPYEQSELMHAALQALGVPVQLIRIEGARHGPDFPGATGAPDHLGAMVRWFDRHLRNMPMPQTSN